MQTATDNKKLNIVRQLVGPPNLYSAHTWTVVGVKGDAGGVANIDRGVVGLPGGAPAL